MSLRDSLPSVIVIPYAIAIIILFLVLRTVKIKVKMNKASEIAQKHQKQGKEQVSTILSMPFLARNVELNLIWMVLRTHIQQGAMKIPSSCSQAVSNPNMYRLAS